MKYSVVVKESTLPREEMLIKVKEFQEAFSDAVVCCCLEEIRKRA